MIAQKSQVDGYELQELSSSKGSSTSVSLFDGLTINLPDVPSRPVSDIVRNDRSQLLPTRPVAVDHDNIIAEKCSAPPIEDASLDSSAMEVNEYSSLLPSVDQNPMTSHKEAQKPSKDLSVLYTPIEVRYCSNFDHSVG